ncbi:hypothetical protein WJM95_34950 [Streptomyces sp. f51]|uniref:hypothetical protein n=1 Tax=Streptomyces sp. f51 TaxID=1827742 RepID=UPI0030CF881E
MNDEPARATALVPAEYHLFQIADPQRPAADNLDASQNGLVSAVGGVIEVSTGIHTGTVRVTVETHSQRPDPAPGWEEVAEMSCHSPSGEVLVTPMMDDPTDLPSLASQGPGPYRLRVHALGRDTAVGESTDDVVESYLIQSWPASYQDGLLVKATDDYGAQVRARPADDTFVIDHEDSPDTQIGRERDILRRAGHGDYS